MKWIGVTVAGILIGACFFPWVTVESAQVMISGFHSDIPHFGKPGIVHVFLCVSYVILILVQRSWSVRVAFFLSTVNIAWAARNFFLISACRGGICPQKELALYLILFGAILLTLITLGVSVRESTRNVIK